jgi:predicted Zn finger-like uncharacterized protein
MRVVCPSCSAAYQLDDARVPDKGANVRCSRCQKTFPVKKEASPGQASGPVPLPGGTARTGPGTGGIPLPPPNPDAPARPASRPPTPPAPPSSSTGGIPLPPPEAAFPASPFGATPSAPAPEATPSPFDSGPAGDTSSPFGSEPFAPTASPFTASPFEGADSPFGAAAPPQIPAPAAGALVPPPPPTPPPAAAPVAPPELLGFGEVDLSADAVDAPVASTPESPFDAGSAAAPPPPSDPFASATTAPAAPSRSPAPVVPPPPGDADELEMLFGDAPPAAAPAAKGSAKAGGYHVRRRSGKVFGPFQEAQIVDMLSKGELLGNEDVSTDGSTFDPIAAVPAFGSALRKAAAAQPAPRPAAPALFGDRMAAAKMVEGSVRRPLPPWAKWVAIALPVVVLAGAGVGAGFTRYGFFFSRMLRRTDPAVLANLIGQARVALAKGDYSSERAGLDQAARAVAADPGSAEAAMIHALAVAALETRHGAPPEALAQARKATEALAGSEKGKATSLAAQLAMALCSDPVAATVAQEQALELAQGKRKPDPEMLALLVRSALARGDAARAGTQVAKLVAIESEPRAGLLQAQAAVLQKAQEARSMLEKLVARQPDLLAAQLELGALDERSGDAAQAAARLRPLAADAARAKLAPAERARALSILGSIVSVDPARAAEADKLLSDAVAADPRLPDARVRLVVHRLRHGDAAGAVAATDPVAKDVVQNAELAAARVRALAQAGRALDAAQLADQALARTPGRAELLLGKAFALGIAGKPAEARAVYTDVLNRNPEAVEARVALARYALAAGDGAKAAELLAPALAKGTRDPAALTVGGGLLAAKGDAAGAEAAYRKALEVDPTYAAAELGLARLALLRGDTAAARRSLSSAVDHDPHNADIQVELGTLLWKAGELGPARTAFTAAVEAAPKSALALARLGAVQVKQGELDGAIRNLVAATTEAPNLVEARLWLGRALLAHTETQAALEQLKKAVDLSRTAETLLSLGEAQEKAGSLAEALDSYGAVASLAPGSAEPLERKAALLAVISRCEEAIPVFQRAISIDPKASRLRLGLAECTARVGKHDEAVKLYQALLKSDPTAVQANFLLARSLDESRGMVAALPWYEKAAREEPGNPMPHYYLAYAYKERGQKAKAIVEFKKFLEKKPDAPEAKDIEAEIEYLEGK